MSTRTPEQRRRRWRINSTTMTVAGVLFLLLALVGWTGMLWGLAIVCTLVGLLALSGGIAGFRRLRHTAGA